MDFLKTNRLVLNPLNRSYCSLNYLSWINDEQVIRFLETKKGTSLYDLEQYLYSIEKKKIFAWAIVIKLNNKHIGNIKIGKVNME